jgi:hypothetical protein
MKNKELELWGRKTAYNVRDMDKKQREKLKVDESIATIAGAWERIEERKSNSMMAKTPTVAFEEFWKAYKAGDWSTVASYVTLEIVLGQAARERGSISEESLRQSDLADRVREVFEGTQKEEK